MENKVNSMENREKIVDDLLSRSVSAVYPSKDELKKALLSKKLTIYAGADATGPMLHLGHSTNFILLRKLQDLGHKIILLFGDFTAMIGDPTDKSATRVALSQKEVRQNLKTWEKQIGKILKIGFGGAKIVRNSKWLSKLSFEDVVKLSANFTVSQMLERDMFQKRFKEEKPIHLHEFLYPLMQGYDSVFLDVDLEIGGNDQTFNMLAGRILQRKINNREKFVLTTTLLQNPKTGSKLMSKSEGNFIGLLDSPADMFGKTMALPDETIVSVFKDCTLVSLSEVEKIKSDLENGANPRDSKIALGYELVKMYHGEKEANKAKANFINTFSKGDLPKDIEEVSANKEELLSEVFLKLKIVSSKSDFGRLIKEGAISKVETKEKISDIFAKVDNGGVFKIGKHRFVFVKVK